MLKRIVALFSALAALCDRVCNRSHPARRLVLWILRPAQAVALDCIAGAGPVPLALLWQRGDSLAEARRLSRCFRAAARAAKREIEVLDRCGDAGAMRPGGAAGFGASLGRRFAGPLLTYLHYLIPATAWLSRYPSAPGPPCQNASTRPDRGRIPESPASKKIRSAQPVSARVGACAGRRTHVLSTSIRLISGFCRADLEAKENGT